VNPTRKTIDFLPDRFRQATTRRRSSAWRSVVAVLFVAIFVATAMGLQMKEQDVRREYESVVAQYNSAKAQEAVLLEREATVARLRADAELLTFLRYPWPRSRLIEALLTGLPDTVIVERFRLGTEPRPAEKTSEATGEATKPEANAAGDLAQLRQTTEANDVVLHVEGTTADLPVLHAYLRNLTADGMFADAAIESIEAARENDASAASGPKRSRFTARVVVLPGWGLSRGPAADSIALPPKDATPEGPPVEAQASTEGSLP
jgi:hypothetical protein